MLKRKTPDMIELLPRRIFLDSCTAQVLRDYGDYIYEGEPIPKSDRLHRIPDGIANVSALRHIFLVNERALFEWIVSPTSMQEAWDKRYPSHMQWLWDIGDHSEICLENDAANEESSALAARLDEPRFGYLSNKDKVLLRDAVLLRCHAFLTVERRLPRNAAPIERELSIRVLIGVCPDRGRRSGARNTGHSLDFINKAFECLELIGWEHAAALLPTVVGQMVAARGAEESTAWRQPVDLIALCEQAASELPQLFAARGGMHGWSDHAALARELLGDDPVRIVDALKTAIRAGASPADLSRSLAYGAALRLARFGNANEHGDWETAHHVFTYANAIDQILKRIGIANSDGHIEAMRGILHGAMALYLTRYLNVPPARIPGEHGEQLDDLPADAEAIRAALLDAFDRQRQVDLAAKLVARHLKLGHSPQSLIATLAHALLREDAGFHAYQMLEAGVRQFTVWGNTDEGRHILIAVARYLAAHSPTERAALQTADIARRLMRGGELHQEAPS